MGESSPQSLQYLLALGSNLEPRLEYLNRALRILASKGVVIVQKSHLYSTHPIGPADQEFLNGAILCQSPSEPLELLSILHATEENLDRQRDGKWENRTIDIDMILARTSKDSYITANSNDLTLPHPEAKKRDFVIIPAADIASDWMISAGESIQSVADSGMLTRTIIKQHPWLDSP